MRLLLLLVCLAIGTYSFSQSLADYTHFSETHMMSGPAIKPQIRGLQFDLVGKSEHPNYPLETVPINLGVVYSCEKAPLNFGLNTGQLLDGSRTYTWTSIQIAGDYRWAVKKGAKVTYPSLVIGVGASYVDIEVKEGWHIYPMVNRDTSDVLYSIGALLTVRSLKVGFNARNLAGLESSDHEEHLSTKYQMSVHSMLDLGAKWKVVGGVILNRTKFAWTVTSNIGVNFNQRIELSGGLAEMDLGFPVPWWYGNATVTLSDRFRVFITLRENDKFVSREGGLKFFFL